MTSRIRKEDPARRYAHPGGVFEPRPYIHSALGLLDYVRNRFGFGVEFLHDVHERIPPVLGIWLAREVEKYQLFFLEDCSHPRTVTTFGSCESSVRLR